MNLSRKEGLRRCPPWRILSQFYGGAPHAVTTPAKTAELFRSIMEKWTSTIIEYESKCQLICNHNDAPVELICSGYHYFGPNRIFRYFESNWIFNTYLTHRNMKCPMFTAEVQSGSVQFTRLSFGLRLSFRLDFSPRVHWTKLNTKGPKA